MKDKQLLKAIGGVLTDLKLKNGHMAQTAEDWFQTFENGGYDMSATCLERIVNGYDLSLASFFELVEAKMNPDV